MGCGAECREPDYGMERTFLGWRNLRRRNFMLAAFIWGRRVGRPDLFSCSFPCKLNFLVLLPAKPASLRPFLLLVVRPRITQFTLRITAPTHWIRNCQPANSQPLTLRVGHNISLSIRCCAQAVFPISSLRDNTLALAPFVTHTHPSSQLLSSVLQHSLARTFRTAASFLVGR